MSEKGRTMAMFVDAGHGMLQTQGINNNVPLHGSACERTNLPQQR